MVGQIDGVRNRNQAELEIRHVSGVEPHGWEVLFSPVLVNVCFIAHIHRHHGGRPDYERSRHLADSPTGGKTTSYAHGVPGAPGHRRSVGAS